MPMPKPLTTCPACGGPVRPVAVAGRTAKFGGNQNFLIPSTLAIPTCENCGTTWEDEALSLALDREFTRRVAIQRDLSGAGEAASGGNLGRLATTSLSLGDIMDAVAAAEALDELVRRVRAIRAAIPGGVTAGIERALPIRQGESRAVSPSQAKPEALQSTDVTRFDTL